MHSRSKSEFWNCELLVVPLLIIQHRVNIRGLGAKERKNALNEVRILASLNHPQIIGYKEAFYEEATCSLCIVMEYAEGGDLQKLIDTRKKEKSHIPESEVWKYCVQMISGIKFLHEMSIVHRDLKVNFLMNLKILIKNSQFYSECLLPIYVLLLILLHSLLNFYF